MIALGLVATGITGFAANNILTTSVVNATTANHKLYESTAPSTLEYRFGGREDMLSRRRDNNNAPKTYGQEIDKLTTDEYNQKVVDLNIKYQPMFKLKDSINDLEHKQQQYWVLHEEYNKELRQLTSQWSGTRDYNSISSMLKYMSPKIYLMDSNTPPTQMKEDTNQNKKNIIDLKTPNIDKNNQDTLNNDVNNDGVDTQESKVQTPTQYRNYDNSTKSNRHNTVSDNKPNDNGIANGIRSYIQDRRVQTDKTPQDRYNGQTISHNNRYTNTIGIHTSGGRIATSRDRDATIKRPPIPAPNPNITTPTTKEGTPNTTPGTNPVQPAPAPKA